MEGHAKKCVGRYCELANKTTQQLYKVSTPCIDDHHFKEEKMRSVGELSTICSNKFLKYLYLARIGRLDILWFVNKHTCTFTKSTKACDKRLACLISYIHHTHAHSEKIVLWEAQQINVDYDCFKILILQETLKTQNQHQVDSCAFFGRQAFVPISWMCKKQTSVSHSSSEAEFLSLDAGLRMDGIPALDLWD